MALGWMAARIVLRGWAKASRIPQTNPPGGSTTSSRDNRIELKQNVCGWWRHSRRITFPWWPTLRLENRNECLEAGYRPPVRIPSSMAGSRPPLNDDSFPKWPLAAQFCANEVDEESDDDQHRRVANLFQEILS